MSSTGRTRRKRKCRSRGTSAKRNRNKDRALQAQGEQSCTKSEPNSPAKTSSKAKNAPKSFINSACSLLHSTKKSMKDTGDFSSPSTSEGNSTEPTIDRSGALNCDSKFNPSGSDDITEDSVAPDPSSTHKTPLSNHICDLQNSNMEGDKLHYLSNLLERLSCQYSSNDSLSVPKTATVMEVKETLVNGMELPKEDDAFEEPVLIKSAPENDSANINMTAEEIQSLRKARKEEKKLRKTDKNETTPKKVSENNSLSVVKDTKPEKSKAELRQERRLKQEASRAAKAQRKENEKAAVAPTLKAENKEIVTIATKKKEKKTLDSSKRIPLLDHLATPKLLQELYINPEVIHPAIRTLGIGMENHIIDSCTARVIALIQAVEYFIEDYSTPPSCDLSRDLVDKLAPNFKFLDSCRPTPEPMNNVIKFIKKKINDIPPSLPESQSKEDLMRSLEEFVHQNIYLASEAITIHAQEIISDGDVILTYGFSSLFLDVIEKARESCKNLSVVVVDKPNPATGVHMLSKLNSLGVSTFYRLLTDVSRIISKVTKVIVEAEAVVLNGAVMGPCGMAGLVLMASTSSVPVAVLSHTFKFCNIDLTDSLVINELVNAREEKGGLTCRHLTGCGGDAPLNVVKLVYDVTPSPLVSILVTEQGSFQCSVVPVVIERTYGDVLGHD